MLQKFKITFYALIVLFVLVVPSQVVAADFFAESCGGWNCTYEGQLCPQGAKGASGTSYICEKSKWVPILADSCAGWNCSIEDQICPQGAKGASDKSFICYKSKWQPTSWNQDTLVNCLKFYFSNPRGHGTPAMLIKDYNNAMASSTQPWLSGGCGLDKRWRERRR